MSNLSLIFLIVGSSIFMYALYKGLNILALSYIRGKKIEEEDIKEKQRLIREMDLLKVFGDSLTNLRVRITNLEAKLESNKETKKNKK